jgi:hypothetical protein
MTRFQPVVVPMGGSPCTPQPLFVQPFLGGMASASASANAFSNAGAAQSFAEAAAQAFGAGENMLLLLLLLLPGYDSNQFLAMWLAQRQPSVNCSDRMVQSLRAHDLI